MRVKVIGFVLAVGLVLVSAPRGVWASDEFDDGYYTIVSTSLVELDPSMKALDAIPMPQPKGDLGQISGDLDQVNVILDKIINIGKKVWTLVENNKPVVNVVENTANAVPEGLKNWLQLSGWQNPKSRVFRLDYKNLYGITVVSFSFRVLFTYGGGFNGKGHYVSSATIIPADLNVVWGYTFNAEVSVPNVVNAGTSEDPIGAIELRVKWGVKTVMKYNEMTASYFVRGDGQFVDLTNGTN
jgi:hypothetical protein